MVSGKFVDCNLLTESSPTTIDRREILPPSNLSNGKFIDSTCIAKHNRCALLQCIHLCKVKSNLFESYNFKGQLTFAPNEAETND